ncbi:phage protein, HK97 gp10 family [compost metagenome]
MADDIEFSITGLDSLLGKLDELSYDVKRKGGRSSLRKAAQIVVNHAKQNAAGLDDANTGRSIADNVAMRWNGRLNKRTGDLGFRVGVLHGAVLPKKGETAETTANAPTPHWRLLEFGTEKMRAQPFMRSALADHISEVTGTFVSEYEKSIDRALRRARKKQGA